MSSSYPGHRPVDVFADCTVDTPAGRIVVTGSGRTIALSATRTSTLRWLVNATPGGPGGRKAFLRRVRDGLEFGDLVLSVRTGRREIARIEPDRAGGLLSRWLGVSGVRLRPAKLLLALLSNR